MNASSAQEPEWQYLGVVGIDAGTCAIWDRDSVAPDFQVFYPDPAPALPVAFVRVVGDDIDGPIEVRSDPDAGDVVAVRIEFVNDIADLGDRWATIGELHLPSGHAVFADPYCGPIVPYRQHWEVRPGVWQAEEFHTDDGTLQAVRITWVAPTSG